MPENFKTFNIALDTKKALYGERVVLVEGDTGNRFVITLTDDGSAVDLTDCRVDVVFSGAMGTAMQNSYAENGKVTIGGTLHNEVTIDVKSGSYSTGLNTCEIRVLSGESYETLVTSASFTFNGKKPIIDESTIAASSELPILVSLIAQVSDLTTREQSDWTQTDNTKGNYIQNKPVAGTDYQSPTQTLTAETTLADGDYFAGYKADGSVHRKWSWASIKSAIKTFLFGSVTGIAKLDGAGNVTAAAANTDFAAVTHASRHSVGGDDALSGYATVDANGKVTASEANSGVGYYTASHTLALADAGKLLLEDSTSAIVVTIPANATVSFPVGTEIEIARWNTGAVSITPASGVFTSSLDSLLTISGRYGVIVLKQVATNNWLVAGALA